MENYRGPIFGRPLDIMNASELAPGMILGGLGDESGIVRPFDFTRMCYISI